MKKVVGLIGSLRKESLHRQIFDHYKELCSDSFDLSEGRIQEVPLFNQDREGEAQGIEKLAEQIKDASGIIFFSPEYNYSIPGVLKNTLDWLSRSPLKPLNEKPAAIIGASPGNVGTARMQYHLRQVGVFLNIRFLNKPEVMIGQAMKKVSGGRVTDKDTVEFLKRQIKSFDAFMS